MAFWNRLKPGRPAPQRDWVSLVDGELVYERDAGPAHVWCFPDGDRIGVYFFDLEPDLPRLSDLAPFVARLREQAAGSGARPVECELARIAGIPAVRQIVKIPQQPSGMTYVGSFTIPFAKFSYVIKIQCEERGMTGLREAALLSEAIAADEVTIDPESPHPIQGAWDPDSERYDERFPAHPLSRLRRHLRSAPSACRIHDALLAHPRFPLPEASA